MSEIDLSGTWRAAMADPESRRTFMSVDLADDDDAGWVGLEVPGHWRSHPAFADSNGPLLHRRRFDVESTPGGAERWWLVLDGTFYQGDVWLDGHYVGDTEGYFFPHMFEVTDHIDPGTEHVLAVEVSCAPQNDRTAKRNLTGSLQHATWLDPTWNPGGIWRPVRLEASGPLRIRHTRVRCLEAGADRAVLGLRTVLDSVGPSSCSIRTTVTPVDDPSGGVDHELHHLLAAGENRIEWTMELHQPRLWWPHALGDQPLYDVVIDIHTGDTDTPSDRRELRTGVRSVRTHRWITEVNGERLFLKGTNLGPSRQALADSGPDLVAADIAAAKDLGMDLARVHAHIAHPALYEAADATGMLLWQDLPLQWAYSRSVRSQALRQAREAVDLLAHHPSVAMWCAHNEPLSAGRDGVGREPGATRNERTRRRIGQVLPSWNKTVLDPLVRRTLRTTDGTRPVVASSGLLPQLPRLDSTDSHLWFGWEYGDIDDLVTFAARWPRLVRFVSEFGAQAVPATDEFCEPKRWPDLDWDHLAAVHGLRRDLLDRIAHPSDFATFDAWREATQRYQAHLLRRQIEALRLLKYRPAGGFAQFMLADGHPAISHSLLDHERSPKAAYEAVRQACRPVIVVAVPRGRRRSAGDPPTLDLYVVSDLRAPLGESTVEVVRGDSEPRRWLGEVQADSVTHIATIAPSTDALELVLVGPDGSELASNQYL